MPGQEIVIAAPQQSEREEVGTARMPGAAVVGHGRMISSRCIRRNTLRYCALRGLRAVWKGEDKAFMKRFY
jgi:hypothetical protein